MTEVAFAPFIPEQHASRSYGRGLDLEATTVSELLEQLGNGLPTESFGRLQALLGISQRALAGYLGLSEATLHRRFAEGRFKAEESERLYRYLEVFEQAAALFENDAKAKTWLSRPALALGGQTPLDFARRERGAREVLDLIERLEYGVLG